MTQRNKHEAVPLKKLNVNKKLSVKAIILIVIIALLVTAVSAAAIFVNAKINKLGKNSDIQSTTTTETGEIMVKDEYVPNLDGLERRESGSEVPDGDLAWSKDVMNILLLGTDMKLNDGYDPGRCDATIIMSLNKKTGDIKLVSFERAIGMPVPKYLDHKLNSLLHYGGAEFIQETIEKCFLVDLDAYVKIGYETFPAAIDAIGGIDIDLSVNEAYFMNKFLAYTGIEPLKEGVNHLNGMAAWSYCRLRDLDGDYERQGRVRTSVAAVVERLKGLSLSELNKLVDTILPMVETNLSKSQIATLVWMAPKFMSPEIGQMMVPEDEKSAWSYVTGADEYLVGVDFKAYSEKINTFLYVN